MSQEQPTNVMVRQQIMGEIRQLEANGKELIGALHRLGASADAVEALAKRAEGDAVVLPLTESLFILGEIQNPGQVVVNLGAGFSVVRETSQAVQVLSRKAKTVQEQMDTLNKALMIKHDQLAKME